MIVLSCPQKALAQDASKNDVAKTGATSVFKNSSLQRIAQPIPYWVDTKSLRLRDNPVAGKVVGNLNYGQKIMVYARYENWVRISKAKSKAQWVNSNFLSDSLLTWASYNRNTSTRPSDVIAVRIMDPDNSENRIFGVRLKTSITGNALITTRQDTTPIILYQNHFVSCKNQRVLGVRLVGVGSNFLNAQNEIQNFGLNIYEDEKIRNKALNSADRAISAFACKSQSF